MSGAVAGDWRGIRVRVDCYEGSRANETPRRFRLGGRSVDIARIVDRWLGVDHRYFRVEGDDGRCYILRCDETDGEWTLVGGTGSPRAEAPKHFAK